jgi:hypothetical protein
LTLVRSTAGQVAVAHEEGVGLCVVLLHIPGQAGGAACAFLVFVLDLVGQALAHQGIAQRAAGFIECGARHGGDHDAQLGREFFGCGLGPGRCGHAAQCGHTQAGESAEKLASLDSRHDFPPASWFCAFQGLDR